MKCYQLRRFRLYGLEISYEMAGSNTEHVIPATLVAKTKEPPAHAQIHGGEWSNLFKHTTQILILIRCNHKNQSKSVQIRNLTTAHININISLWNEPNFPLLHFTCPTPIFIIILYFLSLIESQPFRFTKNRKKKKSQPFSIGCCRLVRQAPATITGTHSRETTPKPWLPPPTLYSLLTSSGLKSYYLLLLPKLPKPQ